MSDRSQLISRLLRERDFRAAYIRAKLDVLIPSQLRALRQDKTQLELGQMADMKQSRISAMETPGRVNFNLETLVQMAATHGSGLLVKFVPFSEMLEWENEYSQDTFTVTRLGADIDFLQGSPVQTRVSSRFGRRRRSAPRSAWLPQSADRSNVGGLRIQQPFNEQATSQMKLRFEQPEQPSDIRKLAELAQNNPQAGSVNFNLQNTATGAQPNAAYSAAA